MTLLSTPCRPPNGHTLRAVVVVLAIVALAHVTAETVNVTGDVTTSRKSLDRRPIVIHTVAQSYDKPTLGDYQECHKNRDSCMGVCASDSNRTACEAQCPSCPQLIEQQLVVQGINDTDYRVAEHTPLNTTNIVRLTNEIRNIIENRMGDITARNENNVQVVHQNVSRTGGRFGLGYDQSGPCCLVKRAPKGCATHSRAPRCRRHKTQRQCGERCKARVMYAKSVLRCRHSDSDDMDAERRCALSVSYLPHRQPRTRPCHYTANWPFVSCPRREGHSQCSGCMQLTYAHILQRGIPAHCVRCFGISYVQPRPQPVAWYPPTPIYDGGVFPVLPRGGWPTYDGAYDDWPEDAVSTGVSEDDGWKVEQSKCRSSDGSLMSDCYDDGNAAPSVEDRGVGAYDDDYAVDGSDVGHESSVPNEEFYDDSDSGEGDEYDRNDEENLHERSYRHNTFRRSTYSHRNHGDAVK